MVWKRFLRTRQAAAAEDNGIARCPHPQAVLQEEYAGAGDGAAGKERRTEGVYQAEPDIFRMYILHAYHINYGMEHVVYLMVKKGNRGSREPVAVECLRLGQVRLSRVTLLEAYLEAWGQPSHVCGVIWDKIKERCLEESRRGVRGDAGASQTEEVSDAPHLSQTEEVSDAPRSSQTEEVSGAPHSSQAEAVPKKRSASGQSQEDTEEICPQPASCDQAGKSRGFYAEEGIREEPTYCRQGSGTGRPTLRKEEAGLRELHRYFPDYQVWDRSFQGYLQRRQMAGEWLRVWRVPVFDQYGGAEQLRILLDNVEGWRQFSQILVLGYDPGMAAWLPELARRARGIDFYLEYEPRGMEEIREWIFEEYGLVTQWRILGSQEQKAAQEGERETGKETGKRISYPGLGQYLRGYAAPCLVLDFTDAEDVNMTGLKPGSMWWDMGAREKKRRLLEDRPLGVRYVSLKTLWRDLTTASGT